MTGAPWIGGGPPDHRPWRAITALDRRFDLVPLDLDGPMEASVGVVVVPQLSSLTQPQLERLAEAIDGGVPAILVADPIPIVDLRLGPSEPIAGSAGSSLSGDTSGPTKGNAVGFLARLGVAWRPGDVVVDAEGIADAPLELVTADAKAPLVGPLVLSFSGDLSATGDAIAWTPLVTTRRPTRTAASDDYVQHHPLFGPQLIRSSEEAPVPRKSTDAQVRTIVARVDAPGGTTRAPVIVAADLDVFGDARIDLEIDHERVVNERLLAGLVGQLVGDGDDPVAPVVGAPLLDPATRASVVAIEVRSQYDRRLPAELGSHQERLLQWLRLEHRENAWIMHSGLAEPAEPARVDALLDALATARWEPAPAMSTVLRDPSADGTSDAIRIVARDADGATVLDVLVAGNGDPRLAHPTFASEPRAVRLALAANPSVRSFARGVDLGPTPPQIASASVTTYRIDAARGLLADVQTHPANAAALAALLGARFFPIHRSTQTTALELAARGFNLTQGGKLWGSVGEIELKLASGKTMRVVFGASGDDGRATLVEGRDDDALWIYAVDEAIVQRVLSGS
ncbi:MAG: hypothetical protein IPH07_35065 [Deltaproteobacteria bacterium]|nr:hypothetical protein [Deltaproteobacteria bacterium]MBP7291338.1 hypothetical protein [Nannocystaceae bacterium]